MDWYRRLQLKAQKKRALIEIRTDIRFIEGYRSDWLNYDMPKGRQELRKLMEVKEEKRDQVKIMLISRKIAVHEATKKEHEELKKLEADIIQYIEIV